MEWAECNKHNKRRGQKGGALALNWFKIVYGIGGEGDVIEEHWEWGHEGRGNGNGVHVAGRRTGKSAWGWRSG